MNRNWLSKLVQYGRQSFVGLRSIDLSFDTDADGRRLRSDLDAIRSRFPDHA